MTDFKKLPFGEKELHLLRIAVDKIQTITGRKKIHDPEVREIINIVENFLKRKKRVCYGGTAINNILPTEDQFYNKDVELPDYDFFSPEPLKDAKELADIYYKAGFEEVEAKAGVHSGTFKVFVNFIPIADITEMVPEIFKNILKNGIRKNGIFYSPPNFLRMLAYLELSRPLGDTSRWEKVLKRIRLLNKNYPIQNYGCQTMDVQRFYKNKKEHENEDEESEEKAIFHTVRDSLIDQGVVFFGSIASKLIMKYYPKYKYKHIANTPDFDVLAEDPHTTATIIKERLRDIGVKCKIIKKPAIGEVIAEHYEIRVDKETIVFIYEPLACHSYNEISIGGRKIRIASIDTLLSFYLAFLYTNRPYYNDERILCISEYMFKVQQKNRLKQKGVLKRFGEKCLGVQSTLESMRAKKNNLAKKLTRGSKEWEFHFLRYIPKELDKKNMKNMKKTRKHKKRRKRRTRKRRTKKRGKFLGMF